MSSAEHGDHSNYYWHDDEIRSLTGQVDYLTKKLADEVKGHQHACEIICDLQTRVAELELDSEDLWLCRKEISALSATISSLKTEIEMKDMALGELRFLVDDLKRKISSMEYSATHSSLNITQEDSNGS